ncbi:bifunctional riboflavin kinase/FMN adenylyltransferase [Arcobacter sp. CECT 8986]|uniref:bifunctional riboflavin kinase/FAD synthetase n=1 Tax=Arcobacter sp. CECT 8986 TaxID=2044507 RepID=UPI0010099369|nr:bifunctional riboflavin kinase/FAD synthetase [Arcobacter sp. CECT 8986]RXJ97625.1 bifunctional riboflavin kinase/FMN adenylyltransferase [Arcobacter sp. CECT 8986]
MKKSYSTLVNKKDIQSIAIGGFDGMHIAHQKLFENLDENGAIVTIESGFSNLTPKSFRQEYTNLPVYYYVLDNIKHLEGKEFIRLIKEEFPNLKKIVVGFDFCFGKNRKYCVEDLKELFQGEVVVVDEIKNNGTAIHSRYIRDFIKNGNIKKANEFLGKNYKIVGSQVKGQGLGKSDFVPTINLQVENFLLPNEGVYITKTKIKNDIYNSVTFIGHRVSTDGTYAIETHILQGDIETTYNNVEVAFLDKIRDNKKFDDFKDLKAQILLDIKEAKEFFN